MMRKFFTTLFALVAIAVNAQYIPNGDFSSWKSSCGSTDAVGSMRQRPGVEPTDWNGSSVNQKVGIEKKQQLVFNEGGSVKLQNIWVGALGIGSVAPGYITFGTPWVYATSSLSKCDGGTYGGNSFTYKPDAITGRFKRTDSNSEDSYIVAYFWKGTYTSKIGEKGNPSALRDDVDKAVLGMVTPASRGELVAKCNYSFRSTNGGWQTITVPIEYLTDGTPEKMNVIICGGDYWSRDNLKENTTMYVDDVQFVYYSELASLKYNGKNYFQQGKTSYVIDEPYYENKLSVTSNGRGAVIEKSFNEETCVLTITVKGNDYAANSSNVHTYTVSFKPEVPLTVVSMTPDEPVESLKTIEIEYSDVISGTYKSTSSSKIYVGSPLNKASFTVNGKVLTITLDKEITTPGELPLYIPAGLITREINGKDVTCDGEIVFTVKPLDLVVTKVTPDKPMWYLKNITVEYNDEIVGAYSENSAAKIYVGSSENTASFSVSGKVLSITLDRKLETVGEHALYIPAGLITREIDGSDVVCNGEIKFVVRDPAEKVTAEVVAVTPDSPVQSLRTIVLEYDEEIVGKYDPLSITQIYVDSLRITTKPLKVNDASFVVDSTLLTITLNEEITSAGEYMLYIPEGLITCKSNGEAVECNGEIKFTVTDVSVDPLEIVSVTPDYAVEALQTISIEYSDDIYGTYDESASAKIYLGSDSNVASFVVDGKVLIISLDKALTTPGEYALNIPEGLIKRKANGEDVVCNGEIIFTVMEPEPEPEPDNGPKELGEKLYSLDNAQENKTYVLYNEYFTAYAIYEDGHGDKVWVAGMTGGDGEHQLKDSDYAQEIDITSENACWQVIRDGDKYQLYNVGAGMYLETPMYAFDENLKYCSFSSEPVSLSVVDLGGGKFAFNAYPSHSNAELGYMCAAPQLDAPISVWSADDAGAAWVLIENPNVTTGDIEEPEPTPGEDVDYTPTYTGTRNYSERNIEAVKFIASESGESVYELNATEQVSEYLDLTDVKVVDVLVGEMLTIDFVTEGSWTNHYVYIDYDADGFTAGIEDGSNWRPVGDLVSYSFYNNGGNSDASGWNSEGQMISGDDRSKPVLPSFAVPAAPGVYRLRIKQDWCSIDPAGDSDSNFGGTFSNYGGQIIDVMLNVTDPTGVEGVEAESATLVIYDLQGRRLDNITASGIYIVNGKKVLVK